MAIFVTADTHANDERTLKFCQRPFSSVAEMKSELIRRWNAKVGPDDFVVHLGDVMTYQTGAAEMIDFVQQLNGRKILFRGNHDQNILKEDFLHVFESVDESPRKIVLGAETFFACHYPVQRNLDYYTLTGHIHDKWKAARKMLNVGVDVHNFTPLSLDEIIAYREMEEKGVWDANVYPDAPIEWRKSQTDKRTPVGIEPTTKIIRKEYEAEMDKSHYGQRYCPA